MLKIKPIIQNNMQKINAKAENHIHSLANKYYPSYVAPKDFEKEFLENIPKRYSDLFKDLKTRLKKEIKNIHNDVEFGFESKTESSIVEKKRQYENLFLRFEYKLSKEDRIKYWNSKTNQKKINETKEFEKENAPLHIVAKAGFWAILHKLTKIK